MSGVSAGIAVADGSDSTSSGPDGTSTASNIDGSSGATGGESQPVEKPTSTVGSGREETEPVNEPGSSKTSNSSLSIPVLRWPTPEEVHKTGISAFVGTVDIPVPEVDAFSALRQPEPQPTPTPSFRTQEETPVVDAGGGGSDMLPAATGEPPVLHAPLVAAPLSVPMAPPLSVAPLGASAGAPGAPGAQPVTAGAAGAKPPLARGTAEQTTELASSGLRLTPLSGQATRVGYPRDFRNPTIADLAAIALPGVGGLLFMTFGGGLLGYRQANSLRFVRTQGAERFLR
jgi:hypothetical protein